MSELDQVPESVQRLRKLLDTCFMCKGSRKAATRETTCIGCRKPPDYPLVAPDGQVFVCHACGKKSKKLLGDEGLFEWDESCMMNAMLCYESSIVENEDRVITAKAVEGY